MDLPIPWPLAPMLAKSVTAVPAPDSIAGGLSYEPKWDGFRCLVARDGDEVELGSRGEKPLTRYFPELVEAVRDLLPSRCVVDAELIVRRGDPGAQRLDWEALAQRVHPAESRVRRLSVETPAEIVGFDLLSLGSDPLLDEPFSARRAALVEALAGLATSDPIHLTRTTGDHEEAVDWFTRFEGAGLDGVVAKPLAQPYQPGKRAMLKIKHKRTAEAVVYGYRVHKSGTGVGSLLLGMYVDDTLIPVGGIVGLTTAMRAALIDELDPLVERHEDGSVVTAEGERSRFSGSRDVSLVPLQPDLVVEVSYDQLEGHRFRHAVSFLRWRPDRDPLSCRLDQLEQIPAYDLSDVLVR